MALTGNFEFRRSLTGKIVLRVEEEKQRLWSMGSRDRSYRRWRDATMTDLMQPEMGDLLDLKNGIRSGWGRGALAAGSGLPLAHRARRSEARSDKPARSGDVGASLAYGVPAE